MIRDQALWQLSAFWCPSDSCLRKYEVKYKLKRVKGFRPQYQGTGLLDVVTTEEDCVLLL